MTMTTSPLRPTLRRLHHLLARPDTAATSDVQLLGRFVRQRDDAAFELLVRRHGPMVLGVCRRLLRHEQDAEDAFQATLLALARKAGSIHARTSVGSWLYKVAYRVALRAQAVARRRREGDAAGLPTLPDPRSLPAPDWAEVRGVLDDELNRLPEKYRAPVVLCYLEGLTNEEAARQLSCPAGTLKTRLAYARRLLGGRLARRGLGAAVVPAALVAATVRAAAGEGTAAGAVPGPVLHLTEGVLRAMTLTKLKVAAAVVAAGLALAGSGAVSYRTLAAASGPAAATDDDAAARVDRIKKQIRELQEELRRAAQAAARERPPAPHAPIAVIFGNVPITRQELGEHLIRRLSRPQLEAYVNQRILEHVAREKGVSVSDQEVAAALAAERTALGADGPAFGQVLRRYNKTLAEWKEDVLRPRLLMGKLCRDRVRVTERDLRDAYEADFGPKVQCWVMSWPREEKEKATQVADALRKNSGAFSPFAGRHPNTSITLRHGTGREELERAAFRLRDGEVSPLVETPDGFAVIRCERRIPADASRSFEQVRGCLEEEVRDRLLQEEIARHFQELKKEARPRLLWHPGEG
jgi:RNA polymerase sigma factor (sigma-70 family)